MEVRAAVEVVEGAPRLSRWLRASARELVSPVDAAEARGEPIDRILDAETAIAARDKKGKVTEVDLRSALHEPVARLLALPAVELPSDPDGSDAHGAADATRATEPSSDLSTTSQEDVTSARAARTDPPCRAPDASQRGARRSGGPLPAPVTGGARPGRVIRVAQGELVEEGLREAIGGALVPPRPEAVHRE